MRDNYMIEIVQAWRDKIRSSALSDERKKFMKTARMCDHFYRGAMGTMWSEEFRSAYLGNMDAPKFSVTIAKAFEAVAVMGPSIMWDYPGRVVKSMPRRPLPPAYFGNQQDEATAQYYQEYMQKFQNEEMSQELRNYLMESYLNYSQREQPGGGLTYHSHQGIIEGLVKGRGVLYCDTYSFPGSDKILTKNDYVSVDNLYIDPDCKNANLSDAQWIAIRRYNKYWELERMFKLPKDSLRDKATTRSRAFLYGNKNQDESDPARNFGLRDGDIIEWYEVYSKEGIGTRSLKQPPAISQAFEAVVGDFAYLAIATDINYPLNFGPDVAQSATDEEAKQRLDWPTPFYMDGRWPIALYDIYSVPGSCWPIAPISMGLGELIFMNVLLSVLMERVYNSSGSILVCSKGLEDEVKNRLKDGHFGKAFYAEISDQNQKSIEELVKWIEAPGVPADIYTLLAYVDQMFARRTGLNELMYGGHASGKVSRSAADSTAMYQAANVRPDWMSRQAEIWQTEAANLERIAAGWHVKGSYLVDLLGEEGAEAWTRLIENEDPEVYVRQMRCTLEANSIRKPNKFRDNATIQATIGYILPILQQHWQASGDPEPLNGYLQRLAHAMEEDGQSWMIPPAQPPQPDPNQQQREQIESEKLQEDLAGKRMRNERLRMEMEQGAMQSPEMQAEQPSEAQDGINEIDPELAQLLFQESGY